MDTDKHLCNMLYLHHRLGSHVSSTKLNYIVLSQCVFSALLIKMSALIPELQD